MTRIQCFWMDKSSFVRQTLRRYKTNDDLAIKECPLPWGYHNVSSEPIGDCLVEVVPRLYEGGAVHGDLWPHDDPRWPTHCKCGYEFEEKDHWQYNPDDLYVTRTDGEMYTMLSAPPGAMINATWYRDHPHTGDRINDDGISLLVKLPCGVWWHVDGPSYNDGKVGPGWVRTGNPPNVTARPSILTAGYHGWLTDGWLESC